MKRTITGEVKTESIQSYLDKIDDEEQLKFIKNLNDNPSESLLYSLYRKFKGE